MPDTLAEKPDPAIAAALRTVRARIDAAARSSGRAPDDVTLVAVSKTHSVEAVTSAMDAGQTCFGENRVQEAAEKFGPLRETHPALRLHLIGGLQTNKARAAVRIADVIETLDRERLADAIEEAGQRVGRIPHLLVQVNIGGELQKSGVPTGEADAFIEACRRRFGTFLQGLMCVPPERELPGPYFSRLATLRARHCLPVLSMGMSQDFEEAVRLGATHVRIGSAIFGHRPPAGGSAALQHAGLRPILQPL